MRLLSLVFFAVAALLGSTGRAATNYVDFNIGSDSAAGTSANPWKRIPGDPQASGNSLAKLSTLTSGDVIMVRSNYHLSNGGVTWTSKVGASNNPIRLDFVTWAGTSANVTASNNPSGAGATVHGLKFVNCSGVEIRGANIRDIGGFTANDPVFSGAFGSLGFEDFPSYSVTTAAYGLWMVTCTNMYSISNTIERIGHHRNVIQNTNGNVINGTAVGIQGGDNILLDRFVCTDAGIGLRAQPWPQTGANRLCNLTVTNSLVYGTIRWGLFIDGRWHNALMSNIWLVATTVRDIHEYDIGNWLGAVQDFPNDQPHTDHIFIRTQAQTNVLWANSRGWGSGIGVHVDRCTMSSDVYDDSVNGGTTGLYILNGPGVLVSNCRFFNGWHWFDAYVAGHRPNTTHGAQIVRFYNCLFGRSSTTNRAGIGGIQLKDEDSASQQQVYVESCMFVRNGPGPFITAETTTNVLASLKNNLYWNYNSSYTLNSWNVFKRKVSSSYENLTLPQVQARGWETNAVFGNPMFATFSNNLNTTNADFHIDAASAAKGRSLSHSSFFTKDYFGTTRTTPWDIGIAAFSDSPPGDTNAPTPDPFTIESIASVDNDSAVVTLTAATDNEATVLTYELTITNAPPSVLTQTSRVFSVSSLPANTTIGFKARVADNVPNFTAFSSVSNIITSNAPPIAILNAPKINVTEVVVNP